MAQRPLSSVAEANCDGDASGLLARTVAPLMALPVVSFTVPMARPCAEAKAATPRRRATEAVSARSCSRMAPSYRSSAGPITVRKCCLCLSLAGGIAACSVELVEHYVDHDPRHRDVHPQRQRPAGEPHVAIEAAAESARGGDECHRQDDGREHDVREQDGQIDPPDRALAGEGLRADVRVVDDVAHEEER